MALGNNLKKVGKGKKEENKGKAIKKSKPLVKEEVKVPNKLPAEKKTAPVEFAKPEPKPILTEPKEDHQPESDEGLGRHEMMVVFPLGREEYAMPIEMVSEVISMPAVAPVPQAPGYIVGVANVRGTVMAVLDLEEKFGLKEANANKLQYLMVINSEEYQMGLSLPKVPDTMMVNLDKIDHASALTSNASINDDYIKGVIKKDQRMIILIDVLEMMEINYKNLTDATT